MFSRYRLTSLLSARFRRIDTVLRSARDIAMGPPPLDRHGPLTLDLDQLFAQVDVKHSKFIRIGLWNWIFVVRFSRQPVWTSFWDAKPVNGQQHRMAAFSWSFPPLTTLLEAQFPFLQCRATAAPLGFRPLPQQRRRRRQQQQLMLCLQLQTWGPDEQATGFEWAPAVPKLVERVHITTQVASCGLYRGRTLRATRNCRPA